MFFHRWQEESWRCEANTPTEGSVLAVTKLYRTTTLDLPR